MAPRAESRGRRFQPSRVVLPQVPASDEEAREILLGVVKGKYAGADAAADAVYHGFVERLSGVRCDDAGICDEDAQRG